MARRTHASTPVGRVSRSGDGTTRIFGGIDMGHHDAVGTGIERCLNQCLAVFQNPDERNRASCLGGADVMLDVDPAKPAMLGVENDIVEPGIRHDLCGSRI